MGGSSQSGESHSRTRTRTASGGASTAVGERRFSWSGGGQSAGGQNHPEGFFTQLQFAREAQDLEVAFQRSLAEETGLSGSRLGRERSAERVAERAMERDARTRGPAARTARPLSASREGPMDDQDLLVAARLVAQGLRGGEHREASRLVCDHRGRDDEGIWEVRGYPDSPPGAMTHPGGGQSSGSGGHGFNDREIIRNHGHHSHHARRHRQVGIHSLGRPHSFPLDDGQLGDRALQEVLEESKKMHIITSLPREKYARERHKDLSECELCLVDYEAGDELMRLPCMHLFHSNCVTPWLQKSYSCPVCQTDLAKAVGL